MNKYCSSTGIRVGLIQAIQLKGVDRIIVHSSFFSNFIMSKRTTIAVRNITELAFEYVAISTFTMSTQTSHYYISGIQINYIKPLLE